MRIIFMIQEIARKLTKDNLTGYAHGAILIKPVKKNITVQSEEWLFSI